MALFGALCTQLTDRMGATTGPAFNGGISLNDPRFADVVDDAMDFQDHRCGRPAAAGGVLPAPRPVTTKLLGYILSVVSWNAGKGSRARWHCNAALHLCNNSCSRDHLRLLQWTTCWLWACL
jgi:hypothetical protein